MGLFYFFMQPLIANQLLTCWKLDKYTTKHLIMLIEKEIFKNWQKYLDSVLLSNHLQIYLFHYFNGLLSWLINDLILLSVSVRTRLPNKSTQPGACKASSSSSNCIKSRKCCGNVGIACPRTLRTLVRIFLTIKGCVLCFLVWYKLEGSEKKYRRNFYYREVFPSK